MKLKFIINKTSILFIAKWIAIICFVAFVVLFDGITVHMPREWAQGLNHDMILMRQDPEYMVKLTLTQIVHQNTTLPNDVSVGRWITESVILATSAFLWAVLICGLSHPKGLLFRTDDVKHHIGFSCVLAGTSLFQIIVSIDKAFVWIPWLVTVIVILGVRIFTRLRKKVTDVKKEVILLSPFAVGLLLLLLSWTPLIARMHAGRNIQLPTGAFVNEYMILYNTLMIVLCLAMIALQRYVLKENKSAK